jgi:lipopolysaccharide/colanic/teichoic acid biosynthesis glycosyltransferase
MAGGNKRTGSNDEASDKFFYHKWKRCLDIVGASVLLILLAPVLLLIAFVIKLDSPGPVLILQERMGARRRVKGGQIVWDRQPFRMYKFRSMTCAANQSLHCNVVKDVIHEKIQISDDGRYSFKVLNDPRLTRVGKMLRTMGLDELPQLVNVLQGDMSLVGPRPAPRYEVAEYQPWHDERLHALPGMVALWHVKGHSAVDFDQMVQLDIAYVRNQSLWMDMSIIMRLIAALVFRRGTT